MMTITFAEKKVSDELINELKDIKSVYDLGTLYYLNNARYMLDHYSTDSNDFDKAFVDALFHKSEGLFYELCGIVIEAFNGVDVVLKFDKEFDMDIVEAMNHIILFYFGSFSNIVLTSEDINSLKQINNTEIFSVMEIVKYIGLFLKIREKVIKGQELQCFEISNRDRAFLW